MTAIVIQNAVGRATVIASLPGGDRPVRSYGSTGKIVFHSRFMSTTVHPSAAAVAADVHSVETARVEATKASTRRRSSLKQLEALPSRRAASRSRFDVIAVGRGGRQPRRPS
jgi:hypothetical protein